MPNANATAGSRPWTTDPTRPIAVTTIDGQRQAAGIYGIILYVFYANRPDLSSKRSWSIILSHYPRAEQTNAQTVNRYVGRATPRKRRPKGGNMEAIINLAILAIAGIMIWKGTKLLDKGNRRG